MNNRAETQSETSERILIAAIEQFAKEGFHNTDVQVIADLANVGKGTIYRHFGNKEKLFLAAARNCLNGLLDFIEKRIGDEFVQQNGIVNTLREIGIVCAEYYLENPASIEIMIQERAEFRERVYPSHLMFRAEHRESFTELLQIGIDNGVLRNIDVGLVHAAYSDLIWGSCINGQLEASKAGSVDLVERITVAMDLFLNGFAIEQ